jgi:NAD(P)H-hydrate repair Nnr-like enzyme with NAD(P)H-hydrate epimerase domain
VIARVLMQRGGRVQVVMAAAPASEAAKVARDAYAGPVVDGDARGDVLVDCLYGTGLSRGLGEADLALLTGLAARHRKRSP